MAEHNEEMNWTNNSPTLFKNETDLATVMVSAVEAISDFNVTKPVDSEGFYPIKFLCDFLRNKHPHISYLNRNHIVEFYFKDLAREIQFKGENQIRYDAFKPVDNSEILKDGFPLATLFKNSTDFSSALISVVQILRGKNPPELFDQNGYCRVTDLCDLLKRRMPFLGYINRNHFVELMLKDKQRKITFFGSDLIKYKIKKVVEPPTTLYFGTIHNLATKMIDNGIFSSTKKYIKLYDSHEKALMFASKFITSIQDRVAVLEIKAKEAYNKGLKFSTYEEGEYIVSNVDKEFIEWHETL